MDSLPEEYRSNIDTILYIAQTYIQKRMHIVPSMFYIVPRDLMMIAGTIRLYPWEQVRDWREHLDVD